MRDDLPIAARRQDIVDSVTRNQVTIVTAETASGKSTQIVQYLYEAGFKVIMTEPRVKTVLDLATHIAHEMNTTVGGLVGYHVSGDRKISADTRILICTDGIEVLERVLERRDHGWVLIIDETHTWNKNIEMLIGWLTMRITEGLNLKVVLMSATIDAHTLARHFPCSAHVITAPGRSFPIQTFIAPRGLLLAAARSLLGQGHDILVFQEGREQVERIISLLTFYRVNAALLPLFRELPPEQQERISQSYTTPKGIVATDYANFLTLPGCTVCLDNGLEKRVEVVDGVERLVTQPVSRATLKQRAGRVGRTQPGTYILFSGISPHEREAFPRTDIQRTLIDDVALRFYSIGMNPRDVPFFHRPTEEQFARADNLLEHLGALENGYITNVGREMARISNLPPRFARMVVEGAVHGVAPDVATIACLITHGGIREVIDNWRKYTQETASDLLAELDVWNVYQSNPNAEVWHTSRAQRRIRQIQAALKRVQRVLRGERYRSSSHNRATILTSCVVGLPDCIHTHTFENFFSGSFGEPRELDRNSVLKGHPSSRIVALPFDREFTLEFGNRDIKRLLTMATRMD